MKTHSQEEFTQPVVSTPPEALKSVASMSPEYPKHRDAFIIGTVVVGLVIVLTGGYFFTKRTDTAFREFVQDPVKGLTNLMNGYETYKICESYLRQNERLFRELGREVTFSLVSEETTISRGERRSRIIIKAQGSTDTRNVLFQLKKQRGRWSISYVGLQQRNGTYKTLHPRQR